MFRLLNDRASFYQWDLEQKLIVEDSSVDEVHFCNKTDDCSLVCEVYEQDGKRLVNVPNILLTEAWDIRAYAYCNDCYTKQSERFKVIARTKPADYVYTETEVKSWEDLEARVEALEASGGGSGGGSAIKDGELLLDGGLEIRTTNPYADNAPSFNYIKIGENIDDNEPLTIKGWDFESTFGHESAIFQATDGQVLLKVDRTTGIDMGGNNVHISGGGISIDGTSTANITGEIVSLSGADIQAFRTGQASPNSVITKVELDEALSSVSSDSAEDKANLEITPIGIYIGSDIYDLRVGSGIYTLEEIQEAEWDEGLINYILIFDSGNIVFYNTCTPEEFAAYGFVVGGNYRLTINLDNRSIDKVERVIDLKDKVNKTDFEAAMANVGGAWEQIASITTTEEIGKIDFTIEEFPQIANCKDFLMQMELPKTSENITLGSFYYQAITTNTKADTLYLYFKSNLATSNSAVIAVTVRATFIGDTFHSIGGCGGTAALRAAAESSICFTQAGDIKYLTVHLSTDKVFPIGTKCRIYGLVEG